MEVTPLHSDLLTSTQTGTPQEIKDFLAKPYAIQTGVISNSDTSTTFSLLEVIQSHLSVNIFKYKVNGFLGIRATQVFRLQINANRFQQGRYILFWIPFGGGANNTSTNGFTQLLSRRANKTTITQLPHVEIDINTTTEAILEVPFISSSSYAPIGGSTSSYGCLGFVGLYPYKALTTAGGSTTASYSIYSSLKDVILDGPTVPQMAFVKTRKNPPPSSGSPSSREQREMGLSPLRGDMKKVSATADALGSQIPMLSWITTPVSWACDLVCGIACVFGWSNPLDLAEVTRAVQTIFPFANNCDMPDASMPLSLFARNEVEILPGFAGNDTDEMSIDYIKTIPAYLTSFDFSTSAAVDTSLYNLPICPSTFYSSFTDAGSTVTIANTPVSFISKMFEIWRGSIRVTLKIVKTEFHSGRISIVYIPQEPFGANGTAPTTSTSEQRAYVHREIVDIRAGNQIDLLIPYVSLMPYRNITDVVGNLQIYVVNPLVAPATVPSTITFLVEVAAGPDFEVNIPRAHGMQPIVPTTPQMSFQTKKNDHAVVTSHLGNSQNYTMSHIESRACVGEKIMSLNSLLKSADVFAVTSVVTYPTVLLNPYAVPTYRNSAGSVVVSTAGSVTDNFTFLSHCYLFSRGGVRVRSSSTTPSTSVMDPVYVSLNYYISGAIASIGLTSTFKSTNPHSNMVIQNEAFRGGVEIQIPQYHRLHSRINYMQYETGDLYAFINNNSPVVASPALTCSFSNYGTGSKTFTRQVADDFQFGFFLGVPVTITE